MVPALLLVVVSVALMHWLLGPLVLLLTPLLNLSWLGWGALLILLWLVAGRSSPHDDPRGPRSS